MEGSFQDALWAVSAQRDVLWSHELTSHISKVHGSYFPSSNEQIPRRAIRIHGQHPCHNGRGSKAPSNDSAQSVGSPGKGVIFPKTHQV